jgi:hypothetical protein
VSAGVEWQRREPPLECAAVAGSGATANHLSAAATARLATGALLRAAADTEWLVLIGAIDDLPWVDGATYLGWDAGILVPTTQKPSVPIDLVIQAIPHAPHELVVLVPGAVLVGPMPRRAADPARFRTA